MSSRDVILLNQQIVSIYLIREKEEVHTHGRRF